MHATKPPLAVGDRVPFFTLPSSRGQPVSLAEELARGPVVLAWYLFDFGSVWTLELQGFRENHDRFVALGASVLGLSVESDRAHVAFANHLDLPFPLLSDFNRTVLPDFGMAYTEDAPFRGFFGMSRRAVYVLDREGIIQWQWITDDPLVPPDVQEVLQAVEALTP
jgi:glutaredoxin-dependent peroxiredoxin